MNECYRKRRFVNGIAAAVTAVILAVTGCAGKRELPAEGTKITDSYQITYCTWMDEKDYTEKLVNAFEAEFPNILVDVKYIDDGMKEPELEELLEKEDIDVIGLKNINDVLYLQRKGYLIDLTDQIAASGINISCYGNMYNDISDNGKYYCLPTRKTSWVLAYNTDIFETEGIQIPEHMTWAEFAELAARLTKGSDEDKQWGCYFVDWVYNFIGIQEKTYLYDDNLAYLQKSLEMLDRIYNRDKSSMTPTEMKQKNWLDMFETGNVAMMPMGEWLVGMILEDEKNGETDISWDLAPMPTLERQKDETTWGTYQLASITEKCREENKDTAAFKFLKFLCGEDGAKLYAANGMIPAYIDQDIEKIYRDAVGVHNADVFFETWPIREKPAFEGYAVLEEMLEKEAVAYLEGNQDLETAMYHFEKSRMEYFKQK